LTQRRQLEALAAWLASVSHLLGSTSWTPCAQVSPQVRSQPCNHSLLPLPHPFIIPGGRARWLTQRQMPPPSPGLTSTPKVPDLIHRGSPLHSPGHAGDRFRECYYWDSYWSLRGLLACGLLLPAEQLVGNLLHLLQQHGFVPNGARSYYLNRRCAAAAAALPEMMPCVQLHSRWGARQCKAGRGPRAPGLLPSGEQATRQHSLPRLQTPCSQPPLLSAMVVALYKANGDRGLLRRALPLLVSEHGHWTSGDKALLLRAADGSTHRLSRCAARCPGRGAAGGGRRGARRPAAVPCPSAACPPLLLGRSCASAAQRHE
jgi:hypothetical protein